MLFHPTFIMLFFVSVLIFLRDRNKQIFKFTALSFPVITFISLIFCQGNQQYELYNLKLLWNYDESNKLICYALLLVIFGSNSHAICHNRIKELLLGSTYGAFAIFITLSNDFISMFAGLEIMMIFSSIIIYIGDQKRSKTAAKRYFLTHLASSNMILIGIVHVITQNNSTEIVNLTNLIDNPQYSPTIIYIMLTGMIINIAAFPFSGWMTNYYKEASSTGTLYLINFTTKVSIVLLVKVFAGAEILKYIAVPSILYAGYKAYFEEHPVSLLCYLSIIAMSIMTIGISYDATNAVICYLFIHIIYKFLLVLSAGSLQNVKKFGASLTFIKPHKEVIIALIVGVALMINFPLSLSYFSKLDIAHMVTNSLFYWLILLANLMTIIVLPWRKMKDVITNPKRETGKALFNNKAILVYNILLLTAISFLLGFIGIFLPQLSNLHSIHESNAYSLDILKQLAIFIISIVIILNISQHKKIGKGFNLIDFIGDIWSHFFNKYLQESDPKKVDEEWKFNEIENQLMRKIFLFHSQQTAIFAAFLFFIVLLLILSSAMG